jgi:serralysin
MLWALALIGLLPAAFAVSDMAMVSDEADPSDDATDATAEDSTETTTDTVDLVDPVDEADLSEGVDPASVDTTADDPGEDYTVSLGSGETQFENFTSGEDQVTLDLTDGGTGEFVIEPMLDENGAEIGTSLSYLEGDDETTLSFLGLEDLPVDDISVLITDPDTLDTHLFSLSELGDFGAIDPNDPDAPDVAGPSGSAEDDVLTTNDPDAPDVAGPVGTAEDDVLSPNVDGTPSGGAPTGSLTGETVEYTLGDDGETFILADDAMQGGTDATLALDDNDMPTIDTEGTFNIVTGGAGDDTIAAGDDAAIIDGGAGNDTIYGGDGTAILSGGAGDDTIYAGNDTGSAYVLSGDDGADHLYGGDGGDTILMDAHDVAEGGAGADSFWLYYDASAGVGHAEITDFDQGEDMLRVTLNPDDTYAGTLDVEVSQTEDGLSSQVIVNGDVVAVLYGSPNVTAADVVVELSPSALS